MKILLDLSLESYTLRIGNSYSYVRGSSYEATTSVSFLYKGTIYEIPYIENTTVSLKAIVGGNVENVAGTTGDLFGAFEERKRDLNEVIEKARVSSNSLEASLEEANKKVETLSESLNLTTEALSKSLTRVEKLENLSDKADSDIAGYSKRLDKAIKQGEVAEVTMNNLKKYYDEVVDNGTKEVLRLKALYGKGIFEISSVLGMMSTQHTRLLETYGRMENLLHYNYRVHLDDPKLKHVRSSLYDNTIPSLNNIRDNILAYFGKIPTVLGGELNYEL